MHNIYALSNASEAHWAICGLEMKPIFSHPWDLSPQEAIKLQKELRKRIILKKDFSEVKRIAGADISFSQKTSRAYAAVIVFSFPDNRRLDEASEALNRMVQGEARRQLEVLEEQHATSSLSFPYIPGLLTFREGPLLIEAFKKIKSEPDVIIFDGQGIAHPKRLGLATHMGILLNKPTIGCAKSRLIGTYEEPERKKGSYSLLKDDGEVIGAVLRTKENISPVFVSPGHRIDLQNSIEIVLKCLRGYRLPEPTRQAHLLVNRLRTEDR